MADSYVADNLTISGGTVDNSVIGGVTPTTGTFTTITGTSLMVTGSNGITLENDETINNVSDGTVLITAPTTSLSGDLEITGNDIIFGNDETISNTTDGTLAITAPTTSVSGDLSIGTSLQTATID